MKVKRGMSMRTERRGLKPVHSGKKNRIRKNGARTILDAVNIFARLIEKISYLTKKVSSYSIETYG